MNESKYRRILLKLSGEALMGSLDYGIDPHMLKRVAEEIRDARRLQVEVGVVIGGGNIFRGAGLAQSGIDRVTGDHMGMLATVMNALALADALEKIDVPARVMSAIDINEVCEEYIRRRAISHLRKGRVVICAAGTGNPFFTTDTAASLRAIELGADVMLKATKVDGIYSEDPQKNPQARRYEQLDYDQVIAEKLAVMDTAAIALCREQHMPILIYDMTQPGNLQRVLQGETVGTIVR